MLMIMNFMKNHEVASLILRDISTQELFIIFTETYKLF